MSEGIPKFEKSKETIPSEENILAVFEKLAEGKEFSEVRKKTDEDGIYLWEVALTEVGADGGTTEYSYRREGEFAETKSSKTVVDRVFYDADGFPVGGDPVAEYVDGEWLRVE